jgi:hypothetical protein
MIPYLTLLVDLVKDIAWPLLIFGIAYAFRQPLKELVPTGSSGWADRNRDRGSE